MAIIDNQQLDKMSVIDRFTLRRKCAEDGDINSLLVIAKYRFINGSIASNTDNLPEIAYYFGRLHRIEDCLEFLKDNNVCLVLLPKEAIELAQNLLEIGYNFPNLNEQEICYLERHYCDSRTFELFDIIMFDCNLLSRPIKKFDKKSLKITNKEFSKNLLIETFNCFIKNEELNDENDIASVYHRATNQIVQKKYKEIGLCDYCIVNPITAKELYTLLQVNFGEFYAENFAKHFSDSWDILDDFKDNDFVMIMASDILIAAEKLLRDKSKIELLKVLVATAWLQEVNTKELMLI